MAFLEANNSRRKERFSLLLLEPGEIYFEDFSAFYYSAGLDNEQAIDRRQRGRLKVSSKSVVFDPKDVKYPILKFAFRDVTQVEKWESPLLSRIDSKDQMFLIETEQVTKMKENYAIGPYVFVKEKTCHLFGLIYQPVHSCLASLCQLQRAATLPRSDQVAMINAIVSFRQHRIKFDRRWLEDLYEKMIMETRGDHITPLLTNPGRIVVTTSRLYFQPFNNVEASPVLKILLKDIRRLIRRRFQLKHIGLEIYCHKEAALSHLYLALNDRQTREELVDSILRQPDVALEDLAQENMTLKWQSGLVSNYDYLTYLNSLADRSINDLTQYPVFPWVLADYTSTHLDLSNPASFRDLSKPIGALNPDRLDKLLTRYREMPEPRFLYGSHYSSPGYVLFYLARVAPEYMLCLHNGRFDQPDRMFNSVTDAWNNCLTSFSNFMELIPEFYGSSTDFLCNKERINFGNRQDGRPVGDIEVPPWAEDATDFIKKMREALECDYVSQHLNEWIDLIFGYKQHGTEAELAYNVFYYLTYEGAVDMDSIDEPDERAALEAQIAEFGQTPKQLFISPHPRRKGLPDTCVMTPSPSECGVSTTDGKSESGVATNPSAVVCDSQLAAWRTVNAPELVLAHQLHKEAGEVCPMTDICSSVVTAVKWNTDGSSLLSVSKDTFLKIYSVEDERQLRSVSLSNMALSSLVTTADSKTVIMGCWDNSIYIYSLEFGHTLQTLDAHDDAVSALCLHDNLLVSSSWDSTVKLWRVNNMSTRQRRANIMGELEHESGVTCCDVSCDGSQVAAGTAEGDVCLWDVSTCYLLRHQHAHTGTVHAVAFSPDAQQLISCGEDGYLQVIDVNTGTEIFSKSAGQDLRCAQWDGQTVLVGCGAGNLLVCDLVSLHMESIAQVYTGAVTSLDLCPNGKLATGGMERTVKVWKVT